MHNDQQISCNHRNRHDEYLHERHEERPDHVQLREGVLSYSSDVLD